MKIYEVKTKKDLKEFILFPYILYRENSYWVPPLLIDAKKIAYGKTPLFKKGIYKHFIVKEGNDTLGRITCGIDQKFNSLKSTKEVYFTLFETVNDLKVAKILFEQVELFAKENNMDTIKGPISPTNGDDFRGLLIENFNTPPTILESYNPLYYKKFIENMGFETFYDFYSYMFNLKNLDLKRYEEVTNYAKKRYQFYIVPFSPKNIKKNKEKIIDEIKYVMDLSIPNDWRDPIIPPSKEEIRDAIRELTPLAVPGSLIMAYSKDNEPIGFNVALPNYNEVLKKLNGRIFPLGWLKFLYYKKRIRGAKSFIMFVIPLWQKRGVSSTIYLEGLKQAKKQGYEWVEGGTIGKDNISMRRDAEKLGGKKHKIFRLYIKTLQN